MKVLNFGSCNIDYVYKVESIVTPGETASANDMEIFAGGKGLNQSIACARAGAKIYHAGAIGGDGQFLKDLLEKNGVDVTYLKTVEQKSGHAIIQVASSGENSILVCSGANALIDNEYADYVLSNFAPNDILLLQNEISNVKYIIESAYKKGMKIILNPSPFNDKLKEIDLNMLDVIVVNQTEAQAITGSDNVDKILKFFAENYAGLKVVLTLGSNGSIYQYKGVTCRQESFKVKAVDTTAAGDTFMGYLIAGITRAEEISNIMKKSSLASAIAVSRKGASPSIPTLKEVQSLLDKQIY